MASPACAPLPLVVSPAPETAKQFQGLARQLARLNGKQLARLVPLVGDAVVDAAELAGRISIRNQGRQRQENLVARLLREASEIEGAAGLEPDQLQVWGRRRQAAGGRGGRPARMHACAAA